MGRLLIACLLEWLDVYEIVTLRPSGGRQPNQPFGAPPCENCGYTRCSLETRREARLRDLYSDYMVSSSMRPVFQKGNWDWDEQRLVPSAENDSEIRLLPTLFRAFVASREF